MKLLNKIFGFIQLFLSVLGLVFLIFSVQQILDPKTTTSVNNLRVLGVMIAILIHIFFGTLDGLSRISAKISYKKGFIRFIGFCSSFLFVIGGVFLSIYGNSQVSQSSPKSFTLPMESKAPNFEGQKFNGEEFELYEQKADYIFIDFWATWCSPCVEDLQYIQKLTEKTSNKLVVIGINRDLNRGKAKAFIEKEGYDFINIYDSTGRIAGKYNVESLPKNYLLNKDRQVIEQNIHGQKIITDVKGHLNSNTGKK
jgi:peroxiredoxin